MNYGDVVKFLENRYNYIVLVDHDPPSRSSNHKLDSQVSITGKVKFLCRKVVNSQSRKYDPQFNLPIKPYSM